MTKTELKAQYNQQRDELWLQMDEIVDRAELGLITDEELEVKTEALMKADGDLFQAYLADMTA